jgi:response regulator RpfG family c-di-GMP phosphodiesterase
VSVLKQVLVSDTDLEWNRRVSALCALHSMLISSCTTGEETQSLAATHSPDLIFLDVETRNHSCIEVIRFLRSTLPLSKLILTARSPELLEKQGLKDGVLKSLGIFHTLIKPVKDGQILDCIHGKNEYDLDPSSSSAATPDTVREISEPDESFLPVPIASFFSTGIANVDYYVCLSEARYLKVFSKGNIFKEGTASQFLIEKGIYHLYFKKSDNQEYIRSLNELISTLIDAPRVTGLKIIKGFEEIIGKYVDEIQSTSIDHRLVREGILICQNIYDFLCKHTELSVSLLELSDLSDSCHQEQLLTALYSVMIAKNLSWSSKRTIDFSGFGGMLHGIGKIQLPPNLVRRNEGLLSPKEQEIYCQYPIHGFNLLSQSSAIAEPVRQIVYQHRELGDGQGFPNRLPRNKIYPLAKIVSLARELTTIQINSGLPPKAGIKYLVNSQQTIDRHDGECLKALIQGFMHKH